MTFDDWASSRLDPLLRFAAVLCGNRSLAEDVVQDVLVKAHRHWDTIQAAERPESYLRRMVVNEYVGGYEIRVQGRPVGAVQQVAASLRLADPASPSAWFDGTEAIP